MAQADQAASDHDITLDHEFVYDSYEPAVSGEVAGPVAVDSDYWTAYYHQFIYDYENVAVFGEDYHEDTETLDLLSRWHTGQHKGGGGRDVAPFFRQ